MELILHSFSQVVLTVIALSVNLKGVNVNSAETMLNFREELVRVLYKYADGHVALRCDLVSP